MRIYVYMLGTIVFSFFLANNLMVVLALVLFACWTVVFVGKANQHKTIKPAQDKCETGWNLRKT